MIRGTIIDGFGTGKKVRVSGEGKLNVVVHPHPPEDESLSALPYRQFFKTGAGASDMRVDGSTNSVEFELTSTADRDIYLKTVSVALVDASATLNKFGNLTALTTGLDLIWETLDLGSVTIASALKTNFDLVRLGLGNPSFGDGAGAFRALNVLSTAEGYLPVIDFSLIFGLPYGLRLRKDRNDRVFWRVNDNLSTGIDQFDIIGYGLKI